MTATPETQQDQQPEAASFAETAMKLGGKSDEEARSMGAVDKADDQVEQLFAPKYQTTNSPAFLAVWANGVSSDLFEGESPAVSPDAQKTMDASLDLIRRRRNSGELYDEHGKLSEETLNELSAAGYWGLLVDRQYGGSETPFVAFAEFLTRMATLEPTVAGLASVHGCIGAVDPLRTFGNESQKEQYLPQLASGERLSAFALTEPCAGSDLTALRTRAVLDGDHYVVNGEKLFITNAVPGRTVGLVCLIDDRPAVLIADLPDQEDETFQLVRYGLYALRQSHNNGLKFNNFRVPRENLLTPTRGDGLTIAYHGLNRGRVALCANAAGVMRVMLGSILPWGAFRRTYGEPIARRELVQRRVGRLAGLIVGADALTRWCSGLLDAGYRGEMECIIAKIFGSEAQKEAAIELFMKTHGGRAFLEGHMFGDHIHEFLAPCIYEGEGEMLGMAFFKSLIKEHGKRYFEPIGMALQKAGIRKPNPLNPAHAWALSGAALPWVKWRVGQFLSFAGGVNVPSLPSELSDHAQFATRMLNRSRREIDGLMIKYQLSLPDRQCSIAQASARVQNMIIMLTTALYAGRSDDPTVRGAADVLCRDLRAAISGRAASADDLRAATRLGRQITDDGTSLLDGIDPSEILMSYDQ